MLYVVTGGSASGKSAFAETLVQSFLSEKNYYIATMQPFGEEGKKRIEKHRNMRAGKGFQTVECYDHIGQLIFAGTGEGYSILLECVSNLVANEMFSCGQSGDEVIKSVVGGVEILAAQAEEMVVVTNEVFSDLSEYSLETLGYMRALGEVNRQLARISDRTWEVVYGIPVRIK